MWFFKNKEVERDTIVSARTKQAIVDATETIETKVKEQLEKFFKDATAIPRLEENIQKLKNELAELETKKTQELRDVEHLVKCKIEKAEIEQSKKANELEKQMIVKEMALQKEYFEKSLKQIDSAKSDMQEIYKQILERLPNLNASLEIKRRK